jgi:hypothetical protein
VYLVTGFLNFKLTSKTGVKPTSKSKLSFPEFQSISSFDTGIGLPKISNFSATN